LVAQCSDQLAGRVFQEGMQKVLWVSPFGLFLDDCIPVARDLNFKTKTKTKPSVQDQDQNFAS